ncbi:MAG: hypothetical protein BJBARM5_0210 [Candidatus Parvarchaeum acidophilus ARMAN-5]|jgi:ABC-type transport system involved in multi-copper enzyme maturation permease subunit|uniref:ABC-2 type transporter n=1 Tax=Candidatus Parvarchaeum acidophilus ARMAN-5 TaxID=662762 RepID=D6GUR4_PARA5|nr:MAG: hypothetical protein BJBARM5_0210 [Candidatus Parvarchaeum acidophilus ARMAN-5]
MKTKPFLTFFTAQMRLLRSQIVAFTVLSVILVAGFSFLAVKGNFGMNEFSESLGLIIWIMIGLIGSNLSAETGVSDFSEKTGMLILSQPVDRRLIILSKILACFAAMLLPLIVIYAAGLTAGFLLYGHIIFNAILSFGISLLYTLSFIAFVTGIGTVSKNKSTPLSVGLTVSLLAVFVFAVFGKLLGIEPWFFLPYGGLAISGIMTSSILHINPGNFFFYYVPYVWEALVIILIYLAIFLAVSVIAYSKRQI